MDNMPTISQISDLARQYHCFERFGIVYVTSARGVPHPFVYLMDLAPSIKHWRAKGLKKYSQLRKERGWPIIENLKQEPNDYGQHMSDLRNHDKW